MINDDFEIQTREQAEEIKKRYERIISLVRSPAWKALKAELLAEAREISEVLRSIDTKQPNVELEIMKCHYAWLARMEAAESVDDANEVYQKAMGFLAKIAQ